MGKFRAGDAPSIRAAQADLLDTLPSPHHHSSGAPHQCSLGSKQEGRPAAPTSRRVRLTDAWASASYHLDEDDDPDTFVISFADITIEK
ncbi:hypothetical protein [Streptomyces sp. NPDC056323]|uniref:hypothetical protein n=1 Tax=unclassified Streptomyces TaxID=2593676 RepID=UPI0035D70413